MSLFIQNNNGPIYSDCTITINNGQTTVETPHQEAQPEDITVEPVTAVIQHFPLLTAQCIQEGKAEAVEAELRSAAKGSALKLMQCIRTNEALGYLDTKNLSSQALYDALNAYFGLRYKYPNFAKYRSK